MHRKKNLFNLFYCFGLIAFGCSDVTASSNKRDKNDFLGSMYAVYQQQFQNSQQLPPAPNEKNMSFSKFANTSLYPSNHQESQDQLSIHVPSLPTNNQQNLNQPSFHQNHYPMGSPVTPTISTDNSYIAVPIDNNQQNIPIDIHPKQDEDPQDDTSQPDNALKEPAPAITENLQNNTNPTNTTQETFSSLNQNPYISMKLALGATVVIIGWVWALKSRSAIKKRTKKARKVVTHAS